MDEKTMVNDILTSVKSSLASYEQVITETDNMGLRQLIQQLRNGNESFQYELYKIAQLKGYYKTSLPANSTEIQNVKKELE